MAIWLGRDARGGRTVHLSLSLRLLQPGEESISLPSERTLASGESPTDPKITGTERAENATQLAGFESNTFLAFPYARGLLSQKGIANGRLSEKRVGIFLPLPKATPGLHAHWQQLASALVCSSPGSGTNSYCCWTNTQEIGRVIAQEQGHYTARLYCH